MAPKHHDTMAPRHHVTMAPKHHDTIGTKTPCHYGTKAQWHQSTMALWHRSTMTLWHQSTMALWHQGTITPWKQGWEGGREITMEIFLSTWNLKDNFFNCQYKICFRLKKSTKFLELSQKFLALCVKTQKIFRVLSRTFFRKNSFFKSVSGNWSGTF